MLSIDYEKDMKYFYYLVSNLLHKSATDINNLFNESMVQINTELQTINKE